MPCNRPTRVRIYSKSLQNKTIYHAEQVQTRNGSKGADMKKLLVLAVIFLLVLANNALSLERFPIITTEEMQQLLKDRQAGKINFILVNALDKMIYQNASIPGSVNIPLGKIAANAYKLGQDKDKLIITY